MSAKPLVVTIAQLAAGVLVLTSSGAGTAPSASTDWQARVTHQLLAVWKTAQEASANAAQPSSAAPSGHPKSTYSARYDSHGRLQIDVSFDCAGADPTAELVAAGMVTGTTLKTPPMCVVEGWASVAQIPVLASLAGVTKIDLPHYRAPRKRVQPKPLAAMPSAAGASTIDGNGVTIMAADQYVTNTGVAGAGVTVGIISDDVKNVTVIEGRSELPAVNIVQPSANPTTHTTFTDEGTMMLEEVYAVAPGASLAFCGPETYTEYVGCVANLIAAGATIVSDDLSFAGNDTMSAQNAQTQAVQNLLTSNPKVMLFTSSANNQQNYWQGPYVADNSANMSLTCSGQTDTYFENFGTTNVNTWTLNDTTSSLLVLDWADPFGANVSNFDLYVLDATTGAVVTCSAGAGSTQTQDGFPDGGVTAPGTYNLAIGTPNALLNGKFLKLIGTGDGGESFSINTPGAPSSPQDFATGVFTVGAVDGSNGVGNTIEPFSNTGPIQLELPTPSTLQAPIVAAPDGVFVDTAGTTFQALNGLFYGTSAASPNAAAVAALLRSGFPTLTPGQTITALETGATAIATYGAVPNGTIGYGRVNAIGALGAVPAPTATAISAQTIVGGTSSPALPFTIGGTGALRLSAGSDNTTLIASSGIVIGPSACPASATACTVTLTPVLGQVGTANVTMTVTDGAKRTGSSKFAVTVTKPTPPTVNVTAGAAQTITEGGTLSTVTFTVAGTQTLTVTAGSSNSTLLPASGVSLNSGCGTAGNLTCTANLAVASGQVGSATVTFTVADPYGQSGNGTATVTVNAPPSHGGGSIDVVSLITLGGLLWGQRRFRLRSRKWTQSSR